jgi:hypothetical protein
VNCFVDELPTAICEASAMEVLSLNGLGAAEGCENTFKFPLSGVSLFNTIGGTLPECVWHMGNLTVLHMTGNELTGQLPLQMPHNSRIVDLSLSHNRFSGSIPRGIQMVKVVDLSFNMFSGTYEDDSLFSGNTLLNLEINRLSGQLPVSKLENVSDLNILKGNMFSCATIPANDGYVDDCMCGSSRLNESLVVFASALFFCCLVLMMCVIAAFSRFASGLLRNQVTRLRSYSTYIDEQVKTSDTVHLQPIADLSDKLKSIMLLFIKLGFVVFATTLPIYVVKGVDNDHNYSTHSNTYAWIWTLAYMRGLLPSVLILIAWIVLIGVCYHRIILTAPLTEDFPVAAAVSSKSIVALSSAEKALENDTIIDDATTRPWILLANLTVAIVVNVLYIYSTQQPLSAFSHFGIQLSLAVFRLIYSYWFLPFLSRSIVSPIVNIGFRLRLLIVNNFLIPMVATAFASPACFQVRIIIHHAGVTCDLACWRGLSETHCQYL